LDEPVRYEFLRIEERMTSMTYLHIRGTLSENMIYTARPGHESRRPDRRGQGNPDFELVLLSGEDHVLVRVVPEVSASSCGGTYDPMRFRVRGSLPLHPDGVAYELRRADLRLHRAAIAAEPPKIASVRCTKSEKSITLHWQGPTSQNILYSVVAQMESGRRITLDRGLRGDTFVFDPSRVPASGKGQIVVGVSDGVRSSEIGSENFTLEERAPTLHILSPQGDVHMPFGHPVSVIGCCLDASGQACPPENAFWLLDGEQFTGGSFIAIVEKPRPGKHRLTLAYGDAEARVETSIAFEIEQPDENYRQWIELMGGPDIAS
jgi:hypothetical protein